eukprot:7549719-Lingulodinium_polyedra.AAC.1
MGQCPKVVNGLCNCALERPHDAVVNDRPTRRIGDVVDIKRLSFAGETSARYIIHNSVVPSAPRRCN